MKKTNQNGRAASNPSSPVIARRGLLCATAISAMAALSGCAGGSPSDGGAADGGAVGGGASAGDLGDGGPAGNSGIALVIEPPEPADTVLMVENGCRLAEGEPTVDDTLLRPLEYSDPVFSVADRLPEGMTRADVYYFDLMAGVANTASVKNSQIPCEVADDTTLPEGYSYLVVDVSIRNPLDEKVVFNVASCMVGSYRLDEDPSIAFEGIDASTYPRTEFDQIRYTGEGAFSIFEGADMPLWVSGYDGPGAMQPGDPVGDFWRDLWIIPQKRYQFYYVVSDADLQRDDLAWLISPRSDIDGARTYAYTVELG